MRVEKGGPPGDFGLREIRAQAQVPIDGQAGQQVVAVYANEQALAVGKVQRAATNGAAIERPRAGGSIEGESAAHIIDRANDVHRATGIAEGADATGGVEGATQIDRREGIRIEANGAGVTPSACRADGQNAAIERLNTPVGTGAVVGERSALNGDGPAGDLAGDQPVVDERHRAAGVKAGTADERIAREAADGAGNSRRADGEGARITVHLNEARAASTAFKEQGAAERLTWRKADPGIEPPQMRVGEGCSSGDSGLREIQPKVQVSIDGNVIKQAVAG